MPRTNRKVTEVQQQHSASFLTAPQVASKLGFSRSQIYALVTERAIPHYKIGGALRFKEAEIDAWLSQSWVPVAQ